MEINFKKPLLVAGAFLIGSTLGFADTVGVAGGTPAWQTWTTAQLNSTTAWGTAPANNPTNNPYWNSLSWDGTNKNVGFCLTGTSNCASPVAPGNLPYLGQSNGKAFTDFFFNSSGGTVTATFDSGIAGYEASDSIGWYEVSNPTQLHTLFSGVTAAGKTASFTPTGEYGLVFTDAAIDDTFYSNTALGSDSTYQHFAVFQQASNSYFVGAEDLPSSGTDFDYNDMLIQLTSSNTSAPEPGAVALVGSGLIGLGFLRTRRKAVKIS